MGFHTYSMLCVRYNVFKAYDLISAASPWTAFVPCRIAVVIQLLHVPYCGAHQEVVSKYPMPRNGANLDSVPCRLLHPPPHHSPSL